MSSRSMSSFAAAAFGFAMTWIVAACCLCSIACSSSSSSNVASNVTSSDQACTDSAHAVCTEMQSCTPANVQGTYGDEATCEARVKATCLDSLAAPSTGGSPGKTDA